MRRTLFYVIVAAAVAVAGRAVYGRFNTPPPAPRILQGAVARGNVVALVGATGPIQAERTVAVGTQVTGLVDHLYVDYNSIVRKDQVIAELDTTRAVQAVDGAKAGVAQAQIALANAKDVLATDQEALGRTETLYSDDVETEQDRELAALAVEQDQAAIEQDQETVSLANAALDTEQTNLDHCTIRSPIDGVVVTRNVDEGETVQASISAPTLYTLATDLKTLRIEGQIDESNVGLVRHGQDVLINVDAYPTTTFHGTVREVRLDSSLISNVVTYIADIDVANPNLRLRPGMTASLQIPIWRSSNVLRIPNTAARFRPTADIFTALHQAIPAGWTDDPAPSYISPRTDVHVTPVAIRGAAKIDLLQAPPRRPRTPATVWELVNGQLVTVPVELGISDGTWTEVLSGSLHVGDQLVTSAFVPTPPGALHPPGSNPFMPPSHHGFYGYRGR